MNKQQMTKILGQRLSGRDSQDMKEYLDNEMNLVQRGVLEAGAFLPWFLKDQVSFTVTPEEGVFSLPEDFLKFDLDSGAYVLLPNGKSLAVEPGDFIALQKMMWGESVPTKFALRKANEIQFFPKAPAEYEVVFNYYRREPLLSGTESENWWTKEAPNVFIAEVGKSLSRVLRDRDAHRLFLEQGERAWADLEARDQERRLAGQYFRF